MKTNQFPVWKDWNTVRILGKGSFGAVYEIERQMMGETEKAALKVISIPQSVGDIENLYDEGYDAETVTATFQDHLKSILEEYRMMRKLNGCSNVVNCDDVYYVQHSDGIGWDIFIKMELLTPLAEAIPNHITDSQVIKIGRDLCNALVLCKKHNIIHRDIKPQNIFVSENGDYKLGDFGIAKTVERTTGGTKIGTYKYMAPEVYNNQPYGASADIYSLGIVLYWLLNERRLPFLPVPPATITVEMDEEARIRRMQGDAIPAPKNGNNALKKIILKACAFDPKDRFRSAEEMLEALDKIAYSSVPTPAPWAKWLGVAALGTAVIAGAIAFGNTSSQSKTSAAMEEITITPSTEATVLIENPTEPEIIVTVPATEPEIIVTEPTVPVPSFMIAHPGDLDGIRSEDRQEQYIWDWDYKRGDVQRIIVTNNVGEVPKSAADISYYGDRSVKAWMRGSTLYIWADGRIALPANSSYFFSGFENLEEISWDGLVDTSKVTDMSHMFSACPNLTELDLSSFDTSNVENMDSMFYGLKSLRHLDISAFDTSSVKNMHMMFAYCEKIKALDVSRFDTSRVTSMSHMFRCCKELTTIDVSGFRTNRVTLFNSMFLGCSNLSDINIQNFDFANAKDVSMIFKSTPYLDDIRSGEWNIPAKVDHSEFMDEGDMIDGKPWKEYFNR